VAAEPPTAQALADTLTLDALAANPANPRKPWTDDQDVAFRRSLLEFGDLSGIVRNLTTGQLVGGHKRVEAFRAATATSVTRIPQEPDAQGTVAHGYVIVDGSRFAYREVRWTPAQETLANLAANRWGAEWDWQRVAESLQAVATFDMDLALTGFNPEELQPLLAADWKKPEVTDSEDTGEQHSFSLHLTPEQHAVFSRAKAKIGGELSDGRAVELLAAEYLSGA
jgi:hypothetical protein